MRRCLLLFSLVQIMYYRFAKFFFIKEFWNSFFFLTWANSLPFSVAGRPVSSTLDCPAVSWTPGHGSFRLNIRFRRAWRGGESRVCPRILYQDDFRHICMAQFRCGKTWSTFSLNVWFSLNLGLWTSLKVLQFHLWWFYFFISSTCNRDHLQRSGCSEHAWSQCYCVQAILTSKSCFCVHSFSALVSCFYQFIPL